MKNINTKNNNFGLKKSKWSVVSIALSCLLAGGALAGSAVSIFHISKNYTESAEFKNTVNGRMKIDTPSAETLDDARKIAEDCASKLSLWLKDKGRKNYDVSAEVYENDSTHKFDCYLNAQFEIDKVKNKDPSSIEEKEKKIDNDPYISFFSSNGFNSNEKAFVYRWYVPDPGHQPVWNEPKYTVIPFRDIFSLPKAVGDEDHKAKVLTNDNGESGVVFEIQNDKVPVSDNLSSIYKDLVKAEKDNKDEPEPDPENKIDNEWQKPRLYIVNNLQGLLNEANYHLSNWNANRNNHEYLKWYSDSGYATFAQNYTSKNFNGEEISATKKDEHFKLNDVVNHKETGGKISGLDLFNYIDQTTAGNNDIGFTSEYIDKIVTIQNFKDVMPEKITDSYKNDIEKDPENPNIKYFWYGTSNANLSETFLNNQIKYGFKDATIKELTFDSITDKGETGSEKVFKQITGQDILYQEILPTFIETIFGSNNVIGILSLGFLLFLIALLVILACLYRTTGVFSWICMIFALSMTGLIATIGSMAISMSLLFGLFTMALIGFMSSLAICGRLKRRLKSREDTHVMIRKAFKKSLLPIVDFCIISLIFGVCFTYISPISLNAFGSVLLAGSFMTFISVFLLNGLLNGLFLVNQIMINKYQFFGKPSNIVNEMLAQSNNAVPSTLDAIKLEIPYYSNMSKARIDATSKKALIAICVIAGILIIGIIVFSVVGFTSPKMFHTTTCVAIQFDGNLLEQSWFKGLDYSFYTQNGNWWFFYTNIPITTACQVAQNMAQASGLTYGSLIQCQTIFGSTNQDILNSTLISIIVATLITALYSGLRNNWIAIVPMIAGTFAIPLLILGLSSICQVKFDQFVVLAFSMVSIVNSVFATNIVGSTNESWSRKDAFNNNEFKYIVNVSLTNNWTYIWNLAAAYGLFILIYGLTAPTGLSTVSTIGLLFIGGFVTLIITPFVISFLLYQFMKIRNFALTKKLEKKKTKVTINFDEIDEQGIEGLNQFTKKIPIN